MPKRQRNRRFTAGAALLTLALCITGHAWSSTTVSVEEVLARAGDTGITVDVVIAGHTAAIRGAEINIGYDNAFLVFKKGETVDGDWYQTRIDPVARDESNTLPGQVKILLAATDQGGVAADASAVLARLTFDLSSAAKDIDYPLSHLDSSPGLRNNEIQAVAFSAIGGAVLNAGAPGDISGDGRMTLADAVLSLRIAVDAKPSGIESSSDVNSDGKIGLGDAAYILEKIAGQR